jgi:iron complex transport system substrate-binding protein
VKRVGPRRAVLALTLLVLVRPPAEAALRVVSLNLCTDQMLVLLAPQSVAGLSPLARDPAISAVASRAADLPVVVPAAEAVLRLNPDLVLAEPYGAQAVVAVLHQLGLHVVAVPEPQSFSEIRANIMTLATLLDARARGAALITHMDAELAGLPQPAHPLTAILLEPRGFAAGPASLAAAVLRAAGYRDAARGGWLPLETLLAHPPDLLVIPSAPGLPSLATDLLANPSLGSLPRRFIPAAWLICGSPFAAEAARLIAR